MKYVKIVICVLFVLCNTLITPIFATVTAISETDSESRVTQESLEEDGNSSTTTSSTSNAENKKESTSTSVDEKNAIDSTLEVEKEEIHELSKDNLDTTIDDAGYEMTLEPDIPFITSASIMNGIVYNVSITNVSNTNISNSQTFTLTTSENGQIFDFSRESYLSDQSISQDGKTYTVRINQKIEMGTTFTFSMKIETKGPGDIVTNLEYKNADGNILKSVSNTLTDTTDYQYLNSQEINSLGLITHYGNSFQRNQTINIGTGSLNRRTDFLRFTNESTGYIKDFTLKLKVTNRVDENGILSDTNNTDYNYQINPSFNGALAISGPNGEIWANQETVIENGSTYYIYRFGDVSPRLMQNAAIRYNFKLNARVDESQINHDFLFQFSIYTQEEAIKTPFSQFTVKIVQSEIQPPQPINLNLRLGTNINKGNLYPSTKDAGLIEMYTDYGEGEQSPLTNIETTISIPEGANLTSIMNLENGFINKVEGYYPDSGWKILSEDNGNFLKGQYNFTDDTKKPTILRYTANKWTSNILNYGPMYLAFSVDDNVNPDTSLVFNGEMKAIDKELNSLERNSTVTMRYLNESSVANILNHSSPLNTAVFEKNYLIGNTFQMDDQFYVPSGIIKDFYYFVKVPKNIITAEEAKSSENGILVDTYSDSKYDIVYWNLGDITALITDQTKNMIPLFTINEKVKSGEYNIQVGFGSKKESEIDFTSSGRAQHVGIPSEIKDILGISANKYYTYNLKINVNGSNSQKINMNVKTTDDYSNSEEIAPGKDGMFKFNYQNTGNLSQNNFEAVNILPNIDDTNSASNLPRNSKFSLSLSNVEALRNEKKDNSLVIYYSESENPTRYDRNNNVIGDGKWLNTYTDITKIKAIKVLSTTPIEPSDTITINYAVTAPFEVERGIYAYDNIAVHYSNLDVERNYESGTAEMRIRDKINDGSISGDTSAKFKGNILKPLSEVTLTLYKKDGNNFSPVPNSTVRSIAGKYGFSDLEYGTYKILASTERMIGADFTTYGSYSFVKNTENSAWISVNGSTEFIIDDSSETSLKEINVYFEVTPQVIGKVNFIDKEGTIINVDNILGDIPVVVYDETNTIISSNTKTKNDGTFNVLLPEVTKDTKIRISIDADSVKKKGLILKTEPISTDYKYGIGTTTPLNFNITDEDSPVISIKEFKKVNPKSIEASVSDATAVNSEWSIVNEEGKVVYTEKFTDKVTIDRHLDYLLRDKLFGNYTLTVTSTDLAKNSTIEMSKFRIAKSPEIQVENMKYLVGHQVTEEQFLKDIKYKIVLDSEDTEIISETNDFKIIDFDKLGDYKVSFKVTDSNGSSSEKVVTVSIYTQNYIIHYDSNDGIGDMPDQSITYANKSELTPNKYSRPNYHFTGWNTKPNGSGTTYLDGAEVINLTDKADETINLYAQWTANSLLLSKVPAEFSFTSVLERGVYKLQQNNLAGEAITVENNWSGQDWSVKAAVVANQLTTSTGSIIGVNQFTVNDTPLMGTGATGIVAKSEVEKNNDNNLGKLMTAVNKVSLEFIDDKKEIKVNQQLSGTIQYQLYNTANAQ